MYRQSLENQTNINFIQVFGKVSLWVSYDLRSDGAKEFFALLGIVQPVLFIQSIFRSGLYLALIWKHIDASLDRHPLHLMH